MNATSSDPLIRSVRLRRDEIPDAGTWPWSLAAVRALDDLQLDPGVTFIVGQNGSGKSTLVEGIAVAAGFNPEGGTTNFNFATREDPVSPLGDLLTLIRGVRRPKTGFFLRAESMFNVATEIEDLGMIDSYGGVSLHEVSHGEGFSPSRRTGSVPRASTSSTRRAANSSSPRTRRCCSRIPAPERYFRHLLDRPCAGGCVALRHNPKRKAKPFARHLL